MNLCMKDLTMVASATAFKTSWETMLRMSCYIHIPTHSYRPYSCYQLLFSLLLMIHMTVSYVLERTQIANTPASNSQENNVPGERWLLNTVLVKVEKVPKVSFRKFKILLIVEYIGIPRSICLSVVRLSGVAWNKRITILNSQIKR